jgi:TetR/AcrR family transcriptional regulator, fatty acid metabolism regulator protein
MADKETPKRAIILQAAIKVFAEKGYHNCRTLDISARAGVAYGSLYQYFKSKDDILLSIFKDNWSSLLQRMEKLKQTDGSPTDKLMGVFDFIFRSYKQNPEMMKVIIMDVPRLDLFYSPENWKLYNRFFTGLADIFREGQEKGIFRRDISPIVASFVIYGAVDTTIRQYVYNPEFNHENFPIEEARNEIMRLLIPGYLSKETTAEVKKRKRKDA